MRIRLVILTSALFLGGCGSVIDESSDTGSAAEQTRTQQADNAAPTEAPGSDAGQAPEDSSDSEFPGGVEDGFGIVPEETPEELPIPSRGGDSSEDRDSGEQEELDASDSGSQSNGSTSGGATMAALPRDPDNPGFRVGQSFSNENGTYNRIVMVDDYEKISDPVITDREDLTLSPSDLNDALVFTGRFAAEELAASELAFNYSEEGAEAWFEDHQDSFLYPDLAREGLLNTEAPNQSLALLYTDNGWDRGVPERPSRIQDLSVQLVSVKQDGDQLVIGHLVTFEAKVSGTAGLSGTFTEKTRLYASYTVEKADGDWKIADYETTWDTQY